MTRTVDAWGRVLFQGEDIAELLMRGYKIQDFLIKPDEVVAQYNQACAQHDKPTEMIQPPDELPLTPQDDTEARQRQWRIPPIYRALDVRTLLLARCEQPAEIERVILEMDLFEARGWLPVLRLMCFLVDHWRQAGIVWGVGRGSSVASYCLFLIGIHRVNSLYYNLSITEFLR